MIINAILAVGPKNVIGIDNKLPWHSTLDFKHFVSLTKGKPCIFGKNTFFNLPRFPLKNRLNVVLSSRFTEDECNNVEDGYLRCTSLEDAIASPLVSVYDEIFICGGGLLYKEAIFTYGIDNIYLTNITSTALEKDITDNPDKYDYLPFDLSKEISEDWECIEKKHVNENDLHLTFETLTHKDI